MRTKLAVERNIRGGGRPKYSGTGGTLRLVFKEEGVRGLFRGITPAVISHAPAAAIFFSTYSFIKTRVNLLDNNNINKDMLGSSLGAGAGWGMTCILLNPLFVLKTKQQTQHFVSSTVRPKYTGLISSLRVVVAEQGVRGLYAGVVAAMAGAPGAMIQMPFYEYLKRFQLSSDERPSHGRVAFASSFSSCCVGLVMYPMEVVRLRLQAQGGVDRRRIHVTSVGIGSKGKGGGASVATTVEYRGIIDCFKKIFVEEGFRSFYKGIGSSIIRTVPQSAIGLSCYETILRFTTYFVQWYNM